jgi:hypothetical protein
VAAINVLDRSTNYIQVAAHKLSSGESLTIDELARLDIEASRIADAREVFEYERK